MCVVHYNGFALDGLLWLNPGINLQPIEITFSKMKLSESTLAKIG